MKQLLEQAARAAREGRQQETAQAAEALKKLSRTEEGCFDLNETGMGFWQAMGLAYPVYAAFETACNKKEGYQDILFQIQIISEKLNQDYTFEHAASYLSMLIHTIDQMSLEIYESYRELVELFRAGVKRAVEQYAPGGKLSEQDENAAELFREALRNACACDVLLTEKYQMLF